MKNQSNFDELIAATVLWWVKYIRKIPTEGIFDDRDSQASFMALYHRIKAYKNEDGSDHKIETFMKLMTDYLKEMSTKNDEARLDTDYWPEGPLADICEKAGISGVSFPQKTTVWVNFKEMKVIWSSAKSSAMPIYPQVAKEAI